MGLRDTVQSRVAAAFDTTLADAVRTVTIYATPDSTYDPATGLVATRNDSYPSRGVITPYSSRETALSNGAITNKDLEVIILTNEVAIVPKPGMTIAIEGESEIYSIEESGLDPAQASYTLKVRS